MELSTLKKRVVVVALRNVFLWANSLFCIDFPVAAYVVVWSESSINTRFLQFFSILTFVFLWVLFRVSEGI